MGEDREELIRQIAAMLSEWEESGELPTDFARRLVDLIQLRSAEGRDRS